MKQAEKVRREKSLASTYKYILECYRILGRNALVWNGSVSLGRG